MGRPRDGTRRGTFIRDFSYLDMGPRDARN